MDNPPKSKFPTGLTIFCLAFLLAMIWALVTNHVWEDYYITYRSSKNLATGHGLVFNHGERLHTFTSPLGVLLPAMASVLTGNTSDVGAIWIFRFWSSAAFGGAALLLWKLARRRQYGAVATTVLVACVALDGKSLDFSINGMETGFLLLFLAYTLWAMFAAEGRRWLHLGLAWGALMWTRPDSFLYIGLLSAGVFLFNDAARTGLTRGQWFRGFLLAGAVCTVLYLPWFLWAWSYFGSPIPHTVVAKGNVANEVKTVLGALKTFLDLPWAVWQGKTSLESTFLPSYFQIGGWPDAAIKVTRWVGLVLAFQWVLPWRVEVRTASFGFCGMHVYLSYFPYFPFPWYLPGTMLLAAVTFAGMLAQVLPALRRLGENRGAWARTAGQVLAGAALALLAAQGWLTWQMMREMKVEQELSATAVRRKVGEWLHDHASAGDTVFMEPLGHISYFSKLKTYDFPGLSSREVVRAIKIINRDWAYLVDYLSPDWLVLRPHEIARMQAVVGRIFSELYVPAAEFNTLAQIEARSFYGKGYVSFDAHLTVFHRVKPKRHRVDLSDPAVQANPPLPRDNLYSLPAYKLHATGVMSIRVPAGARHLSMAYGLPAGTFEGPVVTDGVVFQARFVDDADRVTVLLNTTLDPVKNAGDRGLHRLEMDLPPAQNGEIVLFCLAGASDVMDWSCWGLPEFRF